MKRLLVPVALLVLASCASAPDEQDYCRSFGIEGGNPEYAKCTQYYFQQEAEFAADRAVCAREADMVYPTTLYSRPMSYPVRVYSPYGGFPRTEMVHVGADYQQIAEVDRLRMSIIEPCMRKRGWQSGATWQAGRIAPAKAAAAKPLPWAK